MRSSPFTGNYHKLHPTYVFYCIMRVKTIFLELRESEGISVRDEDEAFRLKDFG